MTFTQKEDETFIEVRRRAMSSRPGSSDIPELLIVGTGPVARALVTVAQAASFHVRVAAGPDSPSVGEFEGADEVIVTPTPKTVEALRPGADTFVVLCSDDVDFVSPVLVSLASTDVPYIGVVTNSVPQDLDGFPHDRSRVYSPAGLAIGAMTPEESAVSILAEVISARRGKSTRRSGTQEY